MSQENVKPEQIQASVAAALSRLRGDAAPPSDAPDAVPPASPAPAQGTTQGTTQGATGMAPGMAGMGARPEPFRAANDLRAEPALRPVQSGAPAQAESEPLAAKEPELPRAMFSRPGPIQAAGSMQSGPFQPTPPQQAQTEPAKTPTVQRPASPLARMMTRETLAAEAAAAPGAPTVEKTAAPEQQPDLLAGLPPPPLGDALSEEPDDAGARRRRNRRILALVAAIIVVIAGFWLWSGGGDDAADVPVITADAAPEKVKPADEGGLQVPNQNVQVLDNMNSGEQAAEAETVLPPPEQPVAPPEPSVAESQAPEPPAVIDSNGAAVEDAPTTPEVTAPEPEPTTAAAPAAPTPPAPDPSAEAPAAPAVTAPEPQPAPETASTAEPAPAPEPTPAPAATQEAAVTPPPAPAPTGNSRIQLAAVKSEDGARAEWAKMQKAHPDLLGNLTLTVERVDKSGTIFYRIQAGPLADKNAAKSLCNSLKSRGQDCIVAR